MKGGATLVRSRAIAVALAALAAVAIACGPSYQALYEGDARFEHCYALEETGAPMSQKGDCWFDWIKRYTYGQTRDRVEYAAARYRALKLAHQAPTDEAMMAAAPGEGRSSNISAPAPTSAFAPPPKTLEEGAGSTPDNAPLPGYTDASTAPVVEEAAPTPPGSSCATGCNATWSRCKDRCDAGAVCEVCTNTYKKCMRTCFAK